MSKRLIRTLVALALAGLAIGTAVALAALPRRFDATLRGTNEGANAGAPNGRGTARVTFRSATRVCYRISVRGIDKPTLAHIHKGGPGVSGPIVVDFQPRFHGSRRRVASKCVNTTAAVSRAIRRNPGGYYVNVHTVKFPGGAVRGQLRVHR